MLRYLISLWLFSLGLFAGDNHRLLLPAIARPSLTPTPILWVNRNDSPVVSPSPKATPPLGKVEVLNTSSGKVIEVAEAGANHGNPFIRCSELPEGCKDLELPPTKLPEATPIGIPTPLPTVTPVPTPLPTEVPLPSFWPCPPKGESFIPCVEPIDPPTVTLPQDDSRYGHVRVTLPNAVNAQ